MNSLEVQQCQTLDVATVALAGLKRTQQHLRDTEGGGAWNLGTGSATREPCDFARTSILHPEMRAWPAGLSHAFLLMPQT